VGYVSEAPGLSAWALSDGVVYRTYMTTARGLEPAMAYYGLLDRDAQGAPGGERVADLAPSPRSVSGGLARSGGAVGFPLRAALTHPSSGNRVGETDQGGSNEHRRPFQPVVTGDDRAIR
jgi:hypothetical protein